MIRSGALREDLFYRLNVFEIRIPPLRERPEDILPLAESFVEDLGAGMGRPAAGISRDMRKRPSVRLICGPGLSPAH